MPISADSTAERMKSRAGEPWRPSNGFEGDYFSECVCAHCSLCPDGEPGCEIQLRALFCDIGDDDYPTEWQYGPDGQPRCTAFQPITATITVD